MKETLTVLIGNSDDKLTQERWSLHELLGILRDAMTLRYVHKSDSSPCDPPRVTGQPPTCIPHGRLVRMVVPAPLPVGENTVSVEMLTDYVEQLDRDLRLHRMGLGGMPTLELEETSGHAFANSPAQREYEERMRAKAEHWAHWLGNPVSKISLKEDEAEVAKQRLEVGDSVRLKQVGWYCAGGHVVHCDPDGVNTARDPCGHGVPVFIVEREE